VKQGSCGKCQCRQPVDADPVIGVSLFSSSSVVAHKLNEAFGHTAGSLGPVELVGDDWPARLRQMLQGLSTLERSQVRAAAIGPDKRHDPWRATDAESMLDRMDTPWLAAMINERRLSAHMQPIVDLRGMQVTAFEALMRSELNGQPMSAGQIINAVVAHDALFQFDQLARATALRQCAPKLREGEKLFVNFCPTVIYDPAVCLATTWKIIDELGIDPGSVVFEVVESVQFPQIDHLKRILDAYRDHGAKVALDDLGAGHTALVYIDQLQPDLIKLDRDMIPKTDDRSKQALLRGLVEYAHGRGITVLAEGIETAEQLEIAQSLDIDLGQGWYFGKPQPEPQRELAVDAVEMG